MPRLIEERKVIPGRPEESPLIIQMIVDESKPHAYGFRRVPPELIDRVSAFIEGLCPSDLPACEAEPESSSDLSR